MRYTDFADIYIWPEGILFNSVLSGDNASAAIGMLPSSIASWLAFQNVVCQHASAVAIHNNKYAIAFLGNPRQGKSTLAAAFVKAGFSLITDDVLAIDQIEGQYFARSGYPHINLWPEQIEYFAQNYRSEAIEHKLSKHRVLLEASTENNPFCEVSVPLAAIFLPERRNQNDASNQVQIETVPLCEAVIKLIQNDFTFGLSKAYGQEIDRLEFYSQLVHNVPVYKLIYPHGLPHLASVINTILANL